MALITFITKDGETISVEGQSGSVMELAVQNSINGIEGKCGGVCSCATCHVHVLPEYMVRTGDPDEIEKDMLEIQDDVNEYSRLACQLKISDSLNGVVLRVVN